jgi:hypothetical protein
MLRLDRPFIRPEALIISFEPPAVPIKPDKWIIGSVVIVHCAPYPVILTGIDPYQRPMGENLLKQS